MTQLVGLFSNQTDAEQALNALRTAGVQKNDVQMMVVTPGTAVTDSFNLTGKSADRFQQKAQNGGVLVIINFRNGTLTAQVRDILETQNSLIVAEATPES